jgi:hypothetical protein
LPTNKKKKTTTIVEEIPPDAQAIEIDGGETSPFDLDLHRAEDAETVEQVLRDNGISNVTYRFYDNDGGYCYSSPELDYDRARRETRGGKHCKMGVFVGGRLVRMVPFPLAPLVENTPATVQNPSSNDVTFMKEMLLKLIENRGMGPVTAGPSLTELTSALSNLDNLRGKPESTMDSFQKGMEFAQSLTGSTDWKTDALRTLRDIAPQVMGVFGGKGGMPLNPNPNNQEQPIAQLPPDTVIKAGIQYLKKKAIAGVDPDLIIEWVANNGEEYEALLRVVLNSEFVDFVKFDPEIGTEPFVSWFKPLFDGLRSAFARQDPMDHDTGRDVGDPSHARSDGQSSPNGSGKPKG